MGSHRNHASMGSQGAKQGSHAHTTLRAHGLHQLDRGEMRREVEHECAICCTKRLWPPLRTIRARPAWRARYRSHHILLMARLNDGQWIGGGSVTVEETASAWSYRRWPGCSDMPLNRRNGAGDEGRIGRLKAVATATGTMKKRMDCW